MTDKTLMPANNCFHLPSISFDDDLNVIPVTFDEVVSEVEAVNETWNVVDIDDPDESARMCDIDRRVMHTLLRAPSPDAAALQFKIRTLHEAGYINLDPITLDQLCEEIQNIHSCD